MSFLYNHYPRSYPNFEDNHDLTIGYLLSKFYTIGHRKTTQGCSTGDILQPPHKHLTLSVKLIWEKGKS